MTNSTKTSAQNGSMNQSAQANTNPLAAMNNAIVNSKIQESMKEYGTYTATSDANNEYPPKNQPTSNMNQSSPQNQTTSSTMQNKQNANMTNNTASGTLTAQYDANGKP